MHREVGQGCLADALVRGGGNARLERIEGLVDWGRLEALLAEVYASGTGRPSYWPLVLLKVLLLQSWYGLSDPGAEEALGDRLSFRRFCGLGLDERVPDHSTISRFRSLLSERGLDERLFAEVVSQLDERGLTIKVGTLIDATLVPAAAAPPPSRQDGHSAIDPDARWHSRGGDKMWFGYKLHVAVDHGSGIVRRAEVTPANVADVDRGHDLVVGDEAAVYADKGYVGPRLRQRLAQAGIRNRVQRKARRNHPLTPRERRRNRLIGHVRGRVEGVFGTLKRSYGLARMRFMSLARNRCATLLTPLAWNLGRGAAQAA